MKYVRNLAKADNNVMSVSPQTEKKFPTVYWSINSAER